MDAPDNLPVMTTCTIQSQPHQLFNAWVKPELMRKWLFVDENSQLVDIHTDLRAEGKFSFVQTDLAGGKAIAFSGEYIEIDEPSSLVFTLYAPELFPGESIVTVAIAAMEEGATVRVTHTGGSSEMLETKWKKMLELLKLSLEVW